jgi:ketosteroid isomerase-like protein
MADRESMIELIERVYAARGRGDVDDLVRAFHPEAVFTLAGDKTALEVAGRVHGHRALRETMQGFIATFDFVKRDILTALVEGDRAAVHSRLTVRHSPTGETRNTEVLDLVKFQDGKIAELIEFADTAMIRDMMSREGSGAA